MKRMAEAGRAGPRRNRPRCDPAKIAKPRTTQSIPKKYVFCQRGKMKLAGSLNLKSPQFDTKEIVLEISGDEFILETERAAEEAIVEFDLQVSMDEDEEIEISNDVEAGDIVYDFLPFTISAKKGGSISLTISPRQAVALKDVLGRFLEVHYGINALKAVRRIKQV